MTWLKCEDCGEVFKVDDAARRPPRLEDGLLPWDSVTVCPYCGSEEVVELRKCELCGAPITDETESSFCEDCRDDIDYSFKDLFDSLEERLRKDRHYIVRAVFDRAEEMNWYE